MRLSPFHPPPNIHKRHTQGRAHAQRYSSAPTYRPWLSSRRAPAAAAGAGMRWMGGGRAQQRPSTGGPAAGGGSQGGGAACILGTCSIVALGCDGPRSEGWGRVGRRESRLLWRRRRTQLWDHLSGTEDSTRARIHTCPANPAAAGAQTQPWQPAGQPGARCSARACTPWWPEPQTPPMACLVRGPAFGWTRGDDGRQCESLRRRLMEHEATTHGAALKSR